ncbi:MAG: nuclease-related domain-containing protein [Solirubrobacteraceae bacterium]
MPATSNPKPRRAGTYADDRYKQGRRNYRLRARWILAAAFGPFIIAGLAVLAVERHELSWIAGAVAGAFAAAWFTIRDEPPGYIEHWREGAEGERRTAKALAPLERSGLHVVHDVQARYGNYDHVAVGCAGVFLLETKNPNGIIDLRNGVPHVRRRLDPQANNREDRIRPRALSAAVHVKKDIEQRTGHATWVQAVVVFWSDFPQGLVEHDRCVFIHGARLATWMQSLPDRLDQTKAQEISVAILEMADRERSEGDMGHRPRRLA